MKHERISMKSLSDTIGISVVTIRKALRKLEEAETVTVLKEKRVYQHEGGYRTESRRYLGFASARRCTMLKHTSNFAESHA